MAKWIKAKGFPIAGYLLLVALVCLAVSHVCVSKNECPFVNLDKGEMDALFGACALKCSDCDWPDSSEVAECLHWLTAGGAAGSCLEDGCIKNYYYNATCESGASVDDCTAIKGNYRWNYQVGYTNMSGCTQKSGWETLFKCYYGSPCKTAPYQFKCTMPWGDCNGDQIAGVGGWRTDGGCTCTN